MKKSSIVAILTLCLGVMSFAVAGNSSAAAPQWAGSKYQYVELNEIGDPAEVLVVKEAVAPSLESGEVRIKVLAAPIHPSNLLQIAGNYGTAAVLPSTPGSEGVGEVLEVSSAVTHLSVGQLVLLPGIGTWSEQIVVPAARVIPLPDLGKPSAEVIEQLSMTAINPLTALLLLTSYVDVKKGNWIVQSASNSAVGGYVIRVYGSIVGASTAAVVDRPTEGAYSRTIEQ